MKITGLTGSIAMGKSTVTRQLMRRGTVLADADAIVHRLLQPRRAGYRKVAEIFPGTVTKNGIDRKKLGEIVFSDPEKLRHLEEILHPLVRAEMKRIILQATRQRRERVILEIPLLFETQSEELCDEVVTVTAPIFLQRQRVMRRAGMTEEKFRRILSRQLDDSEKRRRATAVIHTGLGKAHSYRQAARIQ